MRRFFLALAAALLAATAEGQITITQSLAEQTTTLGEPPAVTGGDLTRYEENNPSEIVAVGGVCESGDCVVTRTWANQTAGFVLRGPTTGTGPLSAGLLSHPIYLAPGGNTNDVLTKTGAATHAWAAPAGGSSHNLLSATHTDTTAAAALDDNVIVGSAAPAWERKAIPNCTDTGGQHLNYATATNAFSCGTTGDGGGAGVAISTYETVTTSSVIANTTTETAFSQSKTLSAGLINAAGTRIRVSVSGLHLADTSSHTVNIRVRIGGTNFHTHPVQTIGTGTAWSTVAEAVVRTTGASGTIQPSFGLTLFPDNSGYEQGNTLSASFTKDLTGTLVVDVTAQMSAAGAGNSIDLRTFGIQIIPASGTF